MEAQCIEFPSIDQYRHTVKLVRDRSEYDHLPLPKLWFVGTVKLHGTNAGIQFDSDGVMHCQSRTGIIAPGKTDNAGFAGWVEANKDAFLSLAKPNRVVYGEWCGGNIQKGVAINGLPKMFVVFAVKDGEEWMSREDMQSIDFSPAKMIYDFPHWFEEIDFSRPEESQNKLRELTEAVEAECPVGAALGQQGIGEGIVWRAAHSDAFNTSGMVFKVKGEKHSETKVRTLAAVDVEKIENIRVLVDSIVTPQRLEGRLSVLNAEGKENDIRNTGFFLKAVALDVLKEEKDTIDASGLPLPEVMQRVSRVAKDFYMQHS